MGPIYNDRQSQPEPTATQEPLVEIHMPLPQTGEPPLDVKPRRKRLSDIETKGSAAQAQPQAKPQRPRLAETSESGSDAPPPKPNCPSLVDIAAGSDGQKLRPRAGRPHTAVAQASDGVPGLQNIVDPPHSAGDSPALGQAGAELRTKQSFSMAAVGGLAAALVGATVWALLAAVTNHQLGWMAIGVGLLVGGVVRVLGRGTDKSFGHLGAAASVFGCLLGNPLSMCAAMAGQGGLSPLVVATHVCSNPALIPGTMIAAFHSMDLLFYGISLYGGYRFSFRRVPEAQLGLAAACV